MMTSSLRTIRNYVRGFGRNSQGGVSCRSAKRTQRSIPRLEALEDRTLLSVNPVNWSEIGPGPIDDVLGGKPPVIGGDGYKTQVGAVEDIAVKSLSAGQLYRVYAGTVNGGVWRADFIPSLNAWTNWQPLMD